jgi:hypothetical protein
MANGFAISRSHLIYGLCIPLAVLLGYMLASGLDSQSMAVVVFVLCVIGIPLMMRWHHPLLVLSCNALVCPYFLPGRPMLWMLLAFVSFFISILDRSVGRNLQFFRAKWVSLSLLALAAVVILTASAHGGIGIKTLGSSTYGGKKYFSLLGGIMLYFGMSAYAVKRERAGVYVALFFLSALTALVTYVAAVGGPGFYFIGQLFPIESAVQEAQTSDPVFGGFQVPRLNELSWVANGIFCFLFARYGMRGVLDVSKPWRLLLLGAAFVAGSFSGYRSLLITFILSILILYWVEGLFRPRHLFIMALVLLALGLVAVPNVQRLPLAVQRALAFLPINIDPDVQSSADGSTNWRLDMWREVLPQVPSHLFNGTGYGFDSSDFIMVSDSVAMGKSTSYEMAAAAGDYHNGPLSIVMPFGLYGAVAFCWFLAASIIVLRQNRRYGDPELRNLNTFLLVYFIVRVIGFFFVFGSLHSDVMIFAGLIGLSVSLNGGVCRPPEATPEPEEVLE